MRADLYKRVRNATINSTSGHRVVFHHLLKCGGTSIYRQLRMRYLFSHAIVHIDPIYRFHEDLFAGEDDHQIQNKTWSFREHLLLYYLNCDVRCIAGHVRFSESAYDRFCEQYKFITTLRHPVSWFRSVYLWQLTARKDRWKIDSCLDAFLDTPEARAFGSTYAKFFSGLPADADPTSEHSVERAKSNLAKLHAVGFVEEMQAFEQQLRGVLATRIRLGHENKARLAGAAREDAISGVDLKKVEDINAVNLEIYHFAREKFAPAG